MATLKKGIDFTQFLCSEQLVTKEKFEWSFGGFLFLITTLPNKFVKILDLIENSVDPDQLASDEAS